MLGALDRKDRLRLMKFVCSFAWADLTIRPEERKFICGLVRRLELDPEEAAMVNEWLDVPPRPEEIDPTDIPREHRQIFLDAARAVARADGYVHEEEEVNLALLDALLR